MFWPYAFKAGVECCNCFLLNIAGLTPNALLYGVPLDAIPVKTFHTLFYPVYILDAWSQSAGGLGTPKREPRSQIGIYLGHSPFHAGSVALIFNPCTGQVSPQYHIVFDDTLSTVPYMDAGMVPPNWEDLLWHSTKKATDKDFKLAQDWMDNTEWMPVQLNDTSGSRITNPFAVVTDLPSASTSTSNKSTASNGCPSDAPSPLTIINGVMRATKGGNIRTLATSSSHFETYS
jgi:hypothetical protein